MPTRPEDVDPISFDRATLILWIVIAIIVSTVKRARMAPITRSRTSSAGRAKRKASEDKLANGIDEYNRGRKKSAIAKKRKMDESGIDGEGNRISSLSSVWESEIGQNFYKPAEKYWGEQEASIEGVCRESNTSMPHS